MITISKALCGKKKDLLDYFRNRAAESLEEVRKTFADSEFRERAKEINKSILATRDTLVKTLLQKGETEKWSNGDVLKCVLLITYTNYVVMLESRNDVWPYEYMTFSRRIGELWEPFCEICFEHPIKDIDLFVPPLFSEVKQKLSKEIEDYIKKLKIAPSQKKELKQYYNKVWSFVTSGEIKLELDLHFKVDGEKVVVDFKSGFGSNEKGNTNRLLLVASIYKSLEERYKCIILVRSAEDRNNNYFQTLKNSGIWEAYCGAEAYRKIKEYSGFDIKRWIDSNIDWEHDFRRDTMRYLKDNGLEQYLKW